MGNDGVFLHTRVGIVCESTIIQKWEADPEGDDATSSPLNGYYDYGQLIRFATNQIAVCLEKLPQRGGAGVDVYLLGTNSGPVVFECRSDGQTERNFFFTDVNGDGIGEIVQKEVRSGSSAITIWDWRAESRVFVQRKIKEPSLNWDRLLKINTNAVVF